jgi:predicted dithiol-disulfide oxidoreductase (DUF899 family)
VTLLLVSQAPLAKLAAYKKRMGWSLPWVSAANTDFNYDFDASYTEERVRSWTLDADGLPPIVAQNAAATGTSIPGYLSQSPAMSAFQLQDDLCDRGPRGRVPDALLPDPRPGTERTRRGRRVPDLDPPP